MNSFIVYTRPFHPSIKSHNNIFCSYLRLGITFGISDTSCNSLATAFFNVSVSMYCRYLMCIFFLGLYWTRLYGSVDIFDFMQTLWSVATSQLADWSMMSVIKPAKKDITTNTFSYTGGMFRGGFSAYTAGYLPTDSKYFLGGMNVSHLKYIDIRMHAPFPVEMIQNNSTAPWWPIKGPSVDLRGSGVCSEQQQSVFLNLSLIKMPLIKSSFE